MFDILLKIHFEKKFVSQHLLTNIGAFSLLLFILLNQVQLLDINNNNDDDDDDNDDDDDDDDDDINKRNRAHTILKV